MRRSERRRSMTSASGRLAPVSGTGSSTVAPGYGSRSAAGSAGGGPAASDPRPRNRYVPPNGRRLPNARERVWSNRSCSSQVRRSAGSGSPASSRNPRRARIRTTWNGSAAGVGGRTAASVSQPITAGSSISTSHGASVASSSHCRPSRRSNANRDRRQRRASAAGCAAGTATSTSGASGRTVARRPSGPCRSATSRPRARSRLTNPNITALSA